MRAGPLLVLLLAAAASAPRAAAPAAARWVDAAAAPGGDGTARRPFRGLEEALAGAPGAPLQLRPGRYRLQAPLVLPDGAELRGERAVVEAAGDVPALLDVRGRARVEGLVLEGGRWALVARGAGAQAALTRVTVRGQGEGGLDVEGGALVLREVRLAAAPGGSPLPPRLLERSGDLPPPDAGAAHAGRGDAAWTRVQPATPLAALRLRAGATADARALTVQGPYARALLVVEGATLEVRTLRVEGASTALHVNGGRARVTGAQLRGGAEGAGAFVGGAGRLSLESVRTEGFEFGVQGGSGHLEARELSLARPHKAGLALSRTRATVQGLRVEDAGSFGAVQLGHADVELARLRLLRGDEQGLVAIGGRLVARDVRITGLRSAGGEAEGLVVREGEARVDGLEVRDVEGACLHVVEGGRLELRGAQLSGCTSPGVWVERRGRLDATGLHARATPGGPALVVLDRGELRLRTSRVDGEVAVDCDAGARAELDGVRGAPGADGACVTRTR